MEFATNHCDNEANLDFVKGGLERFVRTRLSMATNMDDLLSSELREA